MLIVAAIMPGMNGWDLLRRLHDMPDLDKIPIATRGVTRRYKSGVEVVASRAHTFLVPPMRCILCHRLLMGSATRETGDVANPDALVLCAVCQALQATERRERRNQIMVRMLDESMGPHQRRHG